MLAAGFVGFAVGAWWMTSLTADWDFGELLLPQIFRGIGLMLCDGADHQSGARHPAARPPQERLGALQPDPQSRRRHRPAAINTVLNNQMDLHLARLHEAVNTASRPALETLSHLTQHFSDFGSDAGLMAVKQLTGLVRRQALVMASADVFLILAVLFVALTALAVLMKRPAPVPAGASGH